MRVSTMGEMVPAFIAGCEVDKINLFLMGNTIGEKVEICPGCFKLAPFGHDNCCKKNHYRFLDYDNEVYSKECYFQKESTFKSHLLKCTNGFNIRSNSHIFEVLTPHQKKIAHIMGKFSQTAQGIDSAMTTEHKFTLGNFRVFVATHDFKIDDRYKKIPIGYISVMMKYHEDLEREIPVIEDIFVFRGFRTKGIASELLDHVITEYNIKEDMGVQIDIAPAFQSILKKRFKYVWECLGFFGDKFFL